ncbi:outer membrane beta-barrel protein [Haloferula rosea]|uniref:Outer membrane beta-barrel protein n=1 Tax=Haloferula rosea TaxID=490093 RepID=A0A934RGQ2_9BACT|nr:outer membrane beta-barrel protein [Haloferula rosea]MBK1828216.1 outer membrane beta-barrel protein [Haloferula rosea]
MTPIKPAPLGLLATILACRLAVASEPSPVEYIPLEGADAVEFAEPGAESERIDDALDAGTGLAPRDEQAPLTEEGWDLGLALRVAYDDNIFLSANRPQSDLVLQITPRIAYAFGRPDDPGCYVRLVYRPSGVLFAENSDESRIDQDFELQAGVVGRRHELGVSTVVRRLGDATPDTGTTTERTEYLGEVRYVWRPREKVKLEVAAGLSGEDYDESRFSDSDRTYGELAVRYAYSPKTEIGAAWRFGRDKVDPGGTQDVNRATARLIWRPRQKWSVDIEAGVEHRNYETGSDLYPVLDARVDWQLREATGVYLTAYRREESSASFPGQNIEVSGVGIGVAQRFGSRWTGQLELGFESNRYKRVTGFTPARRKDNIFYLRPSLEYQLTDQFRASVFYRYEKNDSSGPTFGYKQNQIGVDMTYDF